MTPLQFREPGAAQAGGYVLVVASLLVVVGLIFHPVPAGGFEERASVLSQTPWWGPIHVAIAAGFVLTVLGSMLMLAAGGRLLHPWTAALFWGAAAVGMVFFTGVALINGWVWGRGVGSATGWYFLEPLIYANVPAFLWLGYYGLRIARASQPSLPGSAP